MKSFKSILCASLLTLAMCSAALASGGDITGRNGDITGRSISTNGDITGRSIGTKGDITGLLGDITGLLFRVII